MALLRSVIVGILYTSAAYQPSPGCTGSGSGWVPKGSGDTNTIDIDQQPPREFIVDVGSSVRDAIAAPLLLSFHGQTGTAAGFRQYMRFVEVADDIIIVYPQGLDDSVPGDSGNPDVGTGWNVGTAGDNKTCVAADMVGNSCYASCQAQGKCGPCNWSTCYDDLLFVKKLFKLIAGNMCIDLDRAYVHGGSNGGMLTHYILQEMPDVFAAAVPQYALPLLGYETYPSTLDRTSVMLLYDRWDTVIPWGPFSVTEADGWLYPSLSIVMANIAKVHNCALQAEIIATPWDGGSSKFECVEHKACQSGKRVLQCFYDGFHGSNPKGNSTQGNLLAADIIMWFLRPFSRSVDGLPPGALWQSTLQVGNSSGVAPTSPAVVPPRRLRSNSRSSQ